MYDAVWLYARVLDSLIRKDKSLVQVNGEKSKIVSNFSLSGFALWWHNGRICIWDEKARLHWSVWQVASTMIWNFKWLLENNLLFNSSWQTTPNTTYLSYLYPTHPWSFRVNFHSGHSRLSEIRIMQVCKKHCQRHNGPEGWVHLAKVTSEGHITSSNTNLDHISSSESPLSVN